MQKLVFKTTEDEKNFETARKLLKRTLKLFKANGGIGVAQDQNNNILSYEFVINMGSDPINFGTCLTSFELVAKTTAGLVGIRQQTGHSDLKITL